jgi:multiple sugar transport system permease protein
LQSAARRDGYLLIAPITVFLLVMLAIPFLVDLLYSVSRVTFETLRSPTYLGLANFGSVIRDQAFWGAMLFSLRFALLTTLGEVAIGIFLAVFLAPLLSKRPWLMAILMLPMMAAPALVGLMYRLILHEFVGILPYYFYLFFNDSPSFLAPRNAFWTLVAVETLQWTPFGLLIVYSTYQSIPLEIRESAAIDGAGPWRRLVAIELPWMQPTILLVAFIRFIDSFRVFDNVYTLSGPGAGGATTTMSIYIYEAFFRRDDIGVAVAASLILLLLSFVILAGLLRLARRRS